MFLSNSQASSKRKIVAIAIILALLITALAATQLVNLAKANFGRPFYYSPPSAPLITISSPTITVDDYPIFNVETLDVKFTLTTAWGYYSFSPIQCSLDGRIQKEFPAFNFSPHSNWPPLPPDNSVSFSTILTGLSEGLHSVAIGVIHVSWESGDWVIKNAVPPYLYVPNDLPELSEEYNFISSGLLYFWVDTAPPIISILSIQDKTFNTPDVSLNFTASEPVSWMGYSLNGKATVTVTDTAIRTRLWGADNYYVVLSSLPAGSYSITIYAEDTAGHRGASEPLQFTVTTEPPETEEPTQPQSEPFPTIWIAVSIAVIVAAVVCIGLLVYFRKRKRSYPLST